VGSPWRPLRDAGRSLAVDCISTNRKSGARAPLFLSIFLKEFEEYHPGEKSLP
jgi:hypothetical protein